MTNEAPELQTACDAMRRGAWLEAVEAFRAFLQDVSDLKRSRLKTGY